MSKVKMTFSVPDFLATYLRSTPNASSVVAEAVEMYRSRELEEELAKAYEEDSAEAEELDRDWQPADAGFEE